jgi:hypothetical protein
MRATFTTACALALLCAGAPGLDAAPSPAVRAALALDDDDPPDDPPPDETPPEKAVEVRIETLTGIDYKRGGDLPQEVLDLDGKRVTLDGYMAIGTFEGVSMFELVPEACECGRSKVQHFIEVTMTSGTTTYQPGLLKVTGTLSVGEVEQDGFVVSLYRLEIESLDD